MSEGAPSRAELGNLSRATIVSIVVTGLEFVALAGLVRVLPDWVAYASVQVFANLGTFFLYKYWAFGAGKVGSTGEQYVRQLLVFGGSWLFNTAIASLFSYRVGLRPVIAFAISNVIVYLAWNYPLNRWWVFRDHPQLPPVPLT
jgi:putative flippase GtrA